MYVKYVTMCKKALPAAAFPKLRYFGREFRVVRARVGASKISENVRLFLRGALDILRTHID